jgi:hypothetical protein
VLKAGTGPSSGKIDDRVSTRTNSLVSAGDSGLGVGSRPGRGREDPTPSSGSCPHRSAKGPRL